ncbi:MAG: PilW family protein [Nitrospiria bacterium]
MNQKGATLIELVLSIVIIGLIAYVATDAFVYSSRSILVGNAVREAGEEGRMAASRMVREIRNLRSDRCVSAATANSFTFVDGSNNTITFSWSGTAGDPLLRNSDTLIGKVSNLTFTYYDNAEPPAAVPTPTVCGTPCAPTCTATNIWSINIDLTAQSGTETMQFRSQVHPVNF